MDEASDWLTATAAHLKLAFRGCQLYMGPMSTPPFGVPVGTPPEKVQEALRADVSRRLRSVCAGWEDGDFERLVDDVTATAMKYLKTSATS